MRLTPFFFILLAISLQSCLGEEPELRRLDLQPHGLPITILAPDSAEIVKKDYNMMKDYTVRKGDNYFLQIFEFEADHLDAAGEKLRQLRAVQEDPFFKEVIREDDQGFIFSKMSDSTRMEYDFRYIKILGSRELIFQTGLVGTFSLDEVKRMYKAVR